MYAVKLLATFPPVHSSHQELCNPWVSQSLPCGWEG